MASRGYTYVPLWLAAAVLFGACAGFYFARIVAPDQIPAVDLFTAAQSRYSSYLFSGRKERPSGTREDDLRSYLAYLEERASDRGALNTSVYGFDRALALVRLAQFAQSRKAIADATRLMGDADAICPSTGLRNCSANDLLFTVRERDRRAWGDSINAAER